MPEIKYHVFVIVSRRRDLALTVSKHKHIIKILFVLSLGLALAQINQKLDTLIKNVGALLREPLESAKKFFEQALLHFG